MRDWYDNVPIEEILQEQTDCFPHGPLAIVLPVNVELVSDLPPEAVSLLSQFMAGTLDTYEFMPLILNLRKKVDRPVKVAL